jgi:hypothetical protein
MKILHTLTLGLAIGFTTLTAFTQNFEPSTVPLPSAIAKATKIFIGNAGDQENADCLRAYNTFYEGISKLGRFTLVLDPNEADLVLELHYEIGLGKAVGSGDGVRQFRVVIEDPRSRIILWSLTERTNYALMQKNRDKNLDETVGFLVSDFNFLASPHPVVPNNKSVVKHQPHL